MVMFLWGTSGFLFGGDGFFFVGVTTVDLGASGPESTANQTRKALCLKAGGDARPRHV